MYFSMAKIHFFKGYVYFENKYVVNLQKHSAGNFIFATQ